MFIVLNRDAGMKFAIDSEVDQDVKFTLSGDIEPFAALNAILLANKLDMQSLPGGLIRIARKETLQSERQERESQPAPRPGFTPAVSGRQDTMGLEKKSVEAGTRIPLAIGATRVDTGFDFSDNETLQGMIGDSMLINSKYNVILPKTGYQSQERDITRVELSDDSPHAEERDSPENMRRVPEYVGLPVLSIELTRRQDTEISGRILSNIGGRVNGIAGEILRSAGDSNHRQMSTTLVASLTFRVADRSGSQVDLYVTCPITAVLRSSQEFNIADFIRGTVDTSMTFKQLARQLVGNLGPPRSCQQK
jgi:hypothetical protein